MFAIIGAVLFTVVLVFTALAAFGFPVGEFTMGGQHKILPKKFRIMAIVSLPIQIFAIIIVLAMGAYIPLWFSLTATKVLCIIFASYLTLNTFMNLFSKSKKERYIMTPLSFAAAICFWLTAFGV